MKLIAMLLPDTQNKIINVHVCKIIISKLNTIIYHEKSQISTLNVADVYHHKFHFYYVTRYNHEEMLTFLFDAIVFFF